MVCSGEASFSLLSIKKWRSKLVGNFTIVCTDTILVEA